ncbi:MAG: hypothetical protein H0X30_04040 [Anaerolineae bacterium]|nr:hypothetical protein [Anaerolineae bacterium]
MVEGVFTPDSDINLLADMLRAANVNRFDPIYEDNAWENKPNSNVQN